MCRGTQCQEGRDSWVVPFTSEPSWIYSCLHIQHTQQTGDLPPLRKEKVRGQLCFFTPIPSPYNPWRKGALASKHCSKFRGKSNLVIAQSKGCIHRSELDRQTDRGQTPEDTSLPSWHTGARTAPGSVPQTVQMGNGPIPLGMAKEASFEISGVPKSWACTQNPWRASLETWSPATWNVTRVHRAQKFSLWLVQVQRLKLLGQISLSAFTTCSNHQQICLFYLCFLFKKTN